MRTKVIDEKTLGILSRVTIIGNAIHLTCGQLDRPDYVAVNKILEMMGGKWNKKEKAHLFPSDPTDALENILLTGNITKYDDPLKKYGFFPTPPHHAKRMIELADIKEGMTILEPEAGQGGIADYIPKNCIVHCTEILPDNAKILRDKGYVVQEMDFLSQNILQYDRVIMNPPFERQADIDHVLHAFKFLVPGGKLVANMSNSITFRENKKTTDFRHFMFAYNGKIYENDPGTFKASGTMVNTVIITMTKNNN